MTPGEVEEPTPGEAADASQGEIEDVAHDDDDPSACCGSVSVSDDDVPVPDEESLVLYDGAPARGEDTPAPVTDAPPVVLDNSSSSRRLCA